MRRYITKTNLTDSEAERHIPEEYLHGEGEREKETERETDTQTDRQTGTAEPHGETEGLRETDRSEGTKKLHVHLRTHRLLTSMLLLLHLLLLLPGDGKEETNAMQASPLLLRYYMEDVGVLEEESKRERCANERIDQILNDEEKGERQKETQRDGKIMLQNKHQEYREEGRGYNSQQRVRDRQTER